MIAFARCPFCKARTVIAHVSLNGKVVVTTEATEIISGSGVVHAGSVYCPTDFIMLVAKPVKGTLVPAIACGSECKLATSEACKCSCGGANHGVGASGAYLAEHNS